MNRCRRFIFRTVDIHQTFHVALDQSKFCSKRLPVESQNGFYKNI